MTLTMPQSEPSGPVHLNMPGALLVKSADDRPCTRQTRQTRGSYGQRRGHGTDDQGKRRGAMGRSTARGATATTPVGHLASPSEIRVTRWGGVGGYLWHVVVELYGVVEAVDLDHVHDGREDLLLQQHTVTRHLGDRRLHEEALHHTHPTPKHKTEKLIEQRSAGGRGRRGCLSSVWDVWGTLVPCSLLPPHSTLAPGVALILSIVSSYFCTACTITQHQLLTHMTHLPPHCTQDCCLEGPWSTIPVLCLML